jgi:hypothetical protein
MSIRNRYSEMKEAINYPKYTPQDMKEFDTFLDKYRRDIVLRDRIIRPIDMDEARVGFGAMARRMHLGVPTYAVVMEVMEHGEKGTRYKKPDKYDLFSHKYKAWEEWKAKIKYAQSKQAEGLLELEKGIDYAIIDGNPEERLLPERTGVEEEHRD